MPMTLKPTQADREIAAELHDEMGMHELAAQVRAGRMDNDTDVQRAMRHRLTAERETREACARIAETAWVSADYDVVGIADADMAMALCKHAAAAIRNTENTDNV